MILLARTRQAMAITQNTRERRKTKTVLRLNHGEKWRTQDPRPSLDKSCASSETVCVTWGCQLSFMLSTHGNQKFDKHGTHKGTELPAPRQSCCLLQGSQGTGEGRNFLFSVPQKTGTPETQETLDTHSPDPSNPIRSLTPPGLGELLTEQSLSSPTQEAKIN